MDAILEAKKRFRRFFRVGLAECAGPLREDLPPRSEGAGRDQMGLRILFEFRIEDALRAKHRRPALFLDIRLAVGIRSAVPNSLWKPLVSCGSVFYSIL